MPLFTRNVAPSAVAPAAPDSAAAVPAWRRWLPLAGTLVVAVAVLVASNTSVLDLLRYAGYAVLSVVGPGTLVFRSLRRQPHTFVEDVAFGTAVGLTLELAAWAVFGGLHLWTVMWLWPLLVYVPFAAVPRLRRHWRVGAYPVRPTEAWSWTVAGSVSFLLLYLYAVFFNDNPIIPDTPSTTQFLDLPYQLSLAAEAKHSMPVGLPQVAGEPLYYHWFSYVHVAMGSLIGHIDLPVLGMRLTVPAILALTTVLLAVVTWRVAGRALAGAVAALLFAVIGCFDFAAVPWPPFGTQVEFVVWVSWSMTYSWPLLIGLIGAAADVLPHENADTVDDGPARVPPLGRGAWVLVAMFALASSGAKASSLPVALSGLALAGVAVLVLYRRFSWRIVGLGAVVGGALLVAIATIFNFQRYGLTIAPLLNLSPYWANPGLRSEPKQLLVVAGIWLAFLLHLQLRGAGFLPLAWRKRGLLTPAQWFLLGGAIGGPALYLTFVGYAATWFTRAGFPFSLVLSAWGFAVVFERAALTRRGRIALGVFAAGFAVLLTAVAIRWAPTQYPVHGSFGPVLPMLGLASVLTAFAFVAGVVWWLTGRRLPGLRGRGGVVLLTGVLVAAAPGLVLDAKMSWNVPGGPYEEKVVVSAAQVQAARWVRGHSQPDDIVATNQHCTTATDECDNFRSFWLSAYSERSVLVEGWSFAPRLGENIKAPFWDPALLTLNDDAFYQPTTADLQALHREHDVRYLVVVRSVRAESTTLATLATPVYDNGSVAVYELR